MANEWMSALPSAFKPVNVNQDIFGGQSAGQRALSVQQAAGQAVTNEAANQERIRKQALQDAVSKAWRTAIGPNGKLIKVFDKERFLAAAGPAGADAYKMYAETMFPQEGKEAVQRGVALNATGGVDPTKTVAEAQRSPYGLDLIKAAGGLQKEQAATGADIAQSRQLTGMIAQPGDARPGTPVGNEQMQVKPLGEITGGAAGAEDVTPAQVASLSPRTRQAALLNLRAAGQALPDTASDADIAKAANNAVAASVQAGLGGLKSMSDLPSAVWNVSQTAGKTRQDVLGKIFGGELGAQAAQLANKRAGIETSGLQAGVSKTQQLAKDLMIPVNMVGNDVSPETQARVDRAQTAINSLGLLRTNIDVIMGNIDSGKINPHTIQGNASLVRDLVAQIGVLSDIYGGTSTEGGIERAMLDIGAPSDIAKAAERGGVEGAVRSWVTNKTVDIPALLRGAPERAAQSVVRLLGEVKSSNPNKVLRDAGFGDLLPKAKSLPSASGLKSGLGNPRVGTKKQFPNGRTATWDGHGWKADE